MAKGHKKSDFDKLVAQMRAYYFKIGSVYCPVLKSNVIFDQRGWGHFFCDTHLAPEIRRRLNLLPYAKKIIKERSSDGIKTFLANRLISHTFIETIDNKKIKTLVFQRGKEFWYVSVYIITEDPFRLIN